jgi:hypothetical protein
MAAQRKEVFSARLDTATATPGAAHHSNNPARPMCPPVKG